MGDQFIGEIRLFAGKVVPSGWLFCNGQEVSIQLYSTLYSLIGTRYGGDGIRSFAVPNLMSRAPMHQGTGPGLTQRILGTKVGSETVIISEANLPAHSHIFNASSSDAELQTIEGNVLAVTPPYDLFYVPKSTTTPSLETNLINGVIGNTGKNGSHENRMPYLAINYIIAYEGIFPPKD